MSSTSKEQQSVIQGLANLQAAARGQQPESRIPELCADLERYSARQLLDGMVALTRSGLVLGRDRPGSKVTLPAAAPRKADRAPRPS